MYPEQWDVQHLNRLLANDVVYQSIVDGEPTSETLRRSQAGLSRFKRTRAQFLLYER